MRAIPSPSITFKNDGTGQHQAGTNFEAEIIGNGTLQGSRHRGRFRYMSHLGLQSQNIYGKEITSLPMIFEIIQEKFHSLTS
jgi:hypothetical protein